MKKYVAMVALCLAIAGTVNAQNAPQRESNNSYGKQDKQERPDRNKRDTFRNKNNRRDNISPEQWATQRTEMLSQKLDLSSKQKRQLQALNLKQARQMEALRNQNQQAGARNGEHRQEMKQLRAGWDKEFKSILNKKQYAKYEQERKQMQAQRGNRQGNNNDNNGRSRRPANG